MSKKDYWDRVKRGICWACSKPALPGLRTCEYHNKYFRQKQKKINRERYLKKVALGICVTCSKPALPGAHVCRYHKEYFRRNRKERWSKYLTEKKCLNCGKNNDSPNSSKFCAECQKRRAQSRRKMWEGHKEKGLCPRCGAQLQPELDAGRVNCKKCRVKASKSARRNS